MLRERKHIGWLLLIAGYVALIPMAQAAYVELQGRQRTYVFVGKKTTRYLGDLVQNGRAESDSLGSVIEIPDRVVVRRGGQIDLRQSMIKWQREAKNLPEFQRPRENRFHDQANTYSIQYYPVSVVNQSKGSRIKSLPSNQTHYYVNLEIPAGTGLFREVSEDELREGKKISSPTTRWSGGPKAGQAEGCSTCGTSQASSLPAPQASQFSPLIESLGNAYHRPSKGLAPNCSRFVREDGSYGDWGRILKSELEFYKVFSQPNNKIAKECPNYNSFDQALKHDFLIRVLTTLSTIESDCLERVEAPPQINPNGIAVGPFQMEQRQSLRMGRDVQAREQYGRSVCAGSPYQAQHNISCATFIFHQQVTTMGLFGSGTYWGPLLRRDRRVVKTIREYRACWPRKANS